MYPRLFDNHSSTAVQMMHQTCMSSYRLNTLLNSRVLGFAVYVELVITVSNHGRAG